MNSLSPFYILLWTWFDHFSVVSCLRFLAVLFGVIVDLKFHKPQFPLFLGLSFWFELFVTMTCSWFLVAWSYKLWRWILGHRGYYCWDFLMFVYHGSVSSGIHFGFGRFSVGFILLSIFMNRLCIISRKEKKHICRRNTIYPVKKRIGYTWIFIHTHILVGFFGYTLTTFPWYAASGLCILLGFVSIMTPTSHYFLALVCIVSNVASCIIL